MIAKKSFGQATVEYVFVLAIIVMLGFEVTRRFTNFFSDQMGRVGHVLSSHLIIGVCPTKCFFAGYSNGYSP
jgi:hypothetical protein